jgi:hypothetical protein
VVEALTNLPHRVGEVFRRPDGLPYERPKHPDDTSGRHIRREPGQEGLRLPRECGGICWVSVRRLFSRQFSHCTQPWPALRRRVGFAWSQIAKPELTNVRY